jgi:RNA polymerase sigma-70 factor (ECF subfamily)
MVGNEHSPLSRLERSERLKRVRAALNELSERDREMLVLRYLEQLSVAETAAVLNLSKDAVKMRHMRALERLREIFDEGNSGA